MQSELLPALLQDAAQLGHCARNEADVLAVYEAALWRLARRAAYPRLYRCAWKLLIQCVQAGDWATLAAVRALPGHQLHCRAVLYCWAHLRDARIGSQSCEHDAALLATRRSGEEAAALLVQARACWRNMTPREAHDQLGCAALQGGRPYLLRLSTTMPGSFTLSWCTPLRAQAQDTRLSAAQAALCAGDDLYGALLAQRMTDPAAQYSVRDLVALLQALEPGCDARDAAERLRAALPLPSGVSRALALLVLRHVFWPRVETRLLEPDDALGETASYVESHS